jgi:hypothetical protein
MRQAGLTGDDLRREVVRRRIAVTWHSEHNSSIWQGDKELVRPDGTLEFEQAQKRTLYFVELDRGATEWEKKVNLYDNARQFGAWQSQFGVHDYPAVLLITPPRRAQRIARTVSWSRPAARYLAQEWPDFLAGGAINGWWDIAADRHAVSLVDYETAVAP